MPPPTQPSVRSTTFRRRLWTTLAISALAAPGALPPVQAAEAEQAEDAAAPVSAESGMTLAADLSGQSGGEGGEGGEAGGEGGEGGITAAAAARDPAVYLEALEVIAAHYLAGRDAYAAGATGRAAEMFAHPMAEVYAPLEAVFAAQGVAPFEQALLDAVDAAGAGATLEAVDARVATVLDAVAAAEARAPEDGRSAAQIRGAVAAGLIERAAQQYRFAVEAGSEEAYLDGYGFTAAAIGALDRWGGDLAAASPDFAERAVEAVALLHGAYPSVLTPDALTAEPGMLLAASSRVSLALGRL
jgi:hypothetical protein